MFVRIHNINRNTRKSLNSNIIPILIATVIVFSTAIYPTAYSSALPNSSTTNTTNKMQETIERAFDLDLIPVNFTNELKKSITREQFVGLSFALLKKMGKHTQSTGKEIFSDISNSSLKQEILAAYTLGIIRGYGDNTFKPYNTITRQEIAILITKLIETINPNININPAKTHTFGDSKEISDWSQKYIFFCFEKNIMVGTGNNFMSPKSNTTSEQAIILMVRAFDFITEFKKNNVQKIPKELKISGKGYESLQSSFGTDVSETIKKTFYKACEDENFKYMDTNHSNMCIFNFNYSGNITQLGIAKYVYNINNFQEEGVVESVYNDKATEELEFISYSVKSPYKKMMKYNEYFIEITKSSSKWKFIKDTYKSKIDEINKYEYFEDFTIYLDDNKSFISVRINNDGYSNESKEIEFRFCDFVKNK